MWVWASVAQITFLKVNMEMEVYKAKNGHTHSWSRMKRRDVHPQTQLALVVVVGRMVTLGWQ